MITHQITKKEVDDNYHQIDILMKPFAHYSEKEVEVIEIASKAIGWTIFSSFVAIKALFSAFICFNPLMVILIKNIFVLEYCSNLILVNI
jgi:hypothetical protein